MKFISSKGSRARRTAKSSALIIALALILVLAVGGTVAYIFTQTGPVINTFTPTEAKITVDEEISGNQKTSITVENISTGVPVYIRVALVANMIDEDGNVTGAADVPMFTPGDNWILGNDGYYYYTKPVPVGQSTGSLLETAMTLDENMQVVVLADAIQAEPTTAVTQAWGVTVENGVIKEAGA
ncbi:MAG: hypothetical protein PUC58_02725 [Oscillospiraceae bacterium]|nr:hypothetical protein [Oscillospiraceae bacterium]